MENPSGISGLEYENISELKNKNKLHMSNCSVFGCANAP